VQPGEAAAWNQAVLDELQQLLEHLEPEKLALEPVPPAPPQGAARRVHTAVPAARLRQLHQSLVRLPDGFGLHPKLERGMQRRREALDELDRPSIDWTLAEQL